jgi:hypothetical protein
MQNCKSTSCGNVHISSLLSAVEAWLANGLGMEAFQNLVKEDSNLEIAQHIGTPWTNFNYVTI